MNAPRRALAVVVIAGSVAILTACGSDDAESASTCRSLQGLAASVRDLSRIDFQASDSGGAQERLDAVRDAARKVEQDASDQFASEGTAVREAIDRFSDGLADGRGDRSLGDFISDVGEGLSAVGEAFDQLRTSADDELSGCDLSPARG